jgi:hypothetical protein
MAAVMLTGSPASAEPGPNCGSYPPGNAYGLRANVAGTVGVRVTRVAKGHTVVLTARVFRNGEVCSGRKVGFWIHGPREFYPDGTPKYHLTGSAITDGRGIASISRTVINSFRWYAEYVSDNGTGVVNRRGADRLIQAV